MVIEFDVELKLSSHVKVRNFILRLIFLLGLVSGSDGRQVGSSSLARGSAVAWHSHVTGACVL